MKESSKTTSQVVGAYLKPGTQGLSALVAHANELRHLDQLLGNALEASLRAHVQVANFRNQLLIIQTHSAALAARLNLEKPRLLQALHDQGQRSISGIEIRVVPARRQAIENPVPRELTNTAKTALRRYAADSGDEKTAARLDRHFDKAPDEEP